MSMSSDREPHFVIDQPYLSAHDGGGCVHIRNIRQDSWTDLESVESAGVFAKAARS